MHNSCFGLGSRLFQSLLILSVPTGTTNGVLRVVDALPITESLALEVAQTGPIASPTADSGPSVPTEAWSGMSCCCGSPNLTHRHKLGFLPSDVMCKTLDHLHSLSVRVIHKSCKALLRSAVA